MQPDFCRHCTPLGNWMFRANDPRDSEVLTTLIIARLLRESNKFLVPTNFKSSLIPHGSAKAMVAGLLEFKCCDCRGVSPNITTSRLLANCRDIAPQRTSARSASQRTKLSFQFIEPMECALGIAQSARFRAPATFPELRANPSTTECHYTAQRRDRACSDRVAACALQAWSCDATLQSVASSTRLATINFGCPG
ncbi:hypothetical protein Q31a_24350 [Aureliella helgolandensis]|uniref:Uncharacterized protein n=1 Tax=Aureliella helgolandensis TaxID=2527968 RepID=A0A518G6A8_9BACT|nr:hypothetical protein Q31a_24350 [Aureliella helgolandensis]